MVKDKEMRKLDTDQVWDYTKRMWKWVAFQTEVLRDERAISELKRAWLVENEPEFLGMTANCFFCYKHDGLCEETCPGSLVAGSWSCCDSAHNYCAKPGAFYREILRLDAIRTAEPVKPEHEWVHGDVFKFETKNDYGTMIYLDHVGQIIPKLEYVDKTSVVCSKLSYYLDAATFLWNIKDKL